ncbi:MAG: alpha/beta hydrolase [Actinomycetota bacterium]
MAEPAFVLVHSPLVGPRTWAPVAATLARRGQRAIVPALRPGEVTRGPMWSHFADRVAASVGPAIRSIVLVAHSGAGPLLPVIGERVGAEVDAYVFADATIPARTGATPVVPAGLMDALRQKAEGGRVPKWSAWFPEDVMRTLVPDDGLRAEVEDELPSLPLAYFEESVPTPAAWTEDRCRYLQFSEAYLPAAADAESKGWPVVRLAGGHLHMLADPLAVTGALLLLASPDPGRKGTGP